MKVINLKNTRLLFIAAIFVGNPVYSQGTNMALPSQVGVYNPNINTQQMQLPSQVGVYNPNMNAPQMQMPSQVGVYQQQQAQMQRQAISNNANYNLYRNMPMVNYNRDPVMSAALYDEVSGYKTPNRYAFNNQPRIVQTTYNNYGNRTAQQLASNSDDYGVEYYMALSYGVATFSDKSGLSGSSVAENQFGYYYDFPMNNVKHTLDDGKNFTIGFGAMSNRKQKVELTFSNISGLSYGEYATAQNQWCPAEFDEYGNFYYDCEKDLPVEGGKISSSTFGINMYFPIAELVGGKLLDGLITPYIGGGIGITFNTIDDYTVYDDIGNGEAPITTTGDPYYNLTEGSECSESDYASGASGCDFAWGYYDYDGVISHYGATTNNVSWNIEAGLSFDLDSKTIIDVYFKHSNLGKIKSKNEVFSSYYSVDILDPTTEEETGTNGISDRCTAEAIDAGFYYNDDTGWCERENGVSEAIVYDAPEKGTLENNEIGVKLRLIF